MKLGWLKMWLEMLIKLKHSKMFHSGVRVINIVSDNWDEMFQQGHLLFASLTKNTVFKTFTPFCNTLKLFYLSPISWSNKI